MPSGPVAVRLEALVRRDGLPLHVACESLRASGISAQTDRELGQLLSSIPERAPLRPVINDDEAVLGAIGPDRTDAAVLAAEGGGERVRLLGALHELLDDLPDEERLVLRLHYWHDMTVADIARAIQRDQKALYRLIDRTLTRLGGALRRTGVSEADLARLAEGRNG